MNDENNGSYDPVKEPIKKVLIVFHCDQSQGVYISFHRDANPYQLVKVARKMTTLKSLSQEAYEMAPHAKTFLVLVRKGGIGEPPFLSRMVAASDLWNVLDLQRKESDTARTLATFVASFMGEVEPKTLNAKIATMTEAQALGYVPSVSEHRNGLIEPPAEDASKIRYPAFLKLKQNKKLFSFLQRMQSEIVLTKDEAGRRRFAFKGPEHELTSLLQAFDDGPFDCVILRDFIRSNGRVYKIAREFGKVLEQADVDVELFRMPSPLDMWIEFPDDLEFPLGNGEAVSSLLIQTRKDWIGFVAMVSDGFRYTIIDKTLYKTIAEVGIAKGRGLAHMRELLQYALKCALYINSGDPDLRDRRPDRPPRDGKEAKKLARSGNRQITLPITLVGFDYKKSRLFKATGTSVRGHFRWQPYGAGRTKVKLIFIAEHKRKYRNRRNEARDQRE